MPWRKVKPKVRNKDNDREYEATSRLTGPLALAAKLRRCRRWQKVRELYLDECPMCCDPFGTHRHEGQERPAEQVHHKVAVVEQPELCYINENLASVCTQCHARLESLEKQHKKLELQNIWQTLTHSPPQS